MTRALHEMPIPEALSRDIKEVMKRHALVEPTVLLAAFAHATGSLYQLIPSSYEDEVELMDLIMENLSQGQQAVVRLQNAKRGQN